ncbi:hypothetical protein CA13_41830 [Planctomycetes bacterium CA13]|uniref:Uncharacterized protein n=1 Tax=Novipirellula herctigrandis TaxID=2527986 RepID=A0A5C5Z6B7_9BACT|nr:hypothetical protein CA13_41830 [Planctomycetes bacterium CA13]
MQKEIVWSYPYRSTRPISKDYTTSGVSRAGRADEVGVIAWMLGNFLGRE